MKCPNGHDNPESAAFCNTCGKSLSASRGEQVGPSPRQAEHEPHDRRGSRLKAMVFAAILMLVLAAVGGGAVFFANRDTDASLSDAPPDGIYDEGDVPSDFTMYGNITLNDSVDEVYSGRGVNNPDRTCTGSGGFSDISEGAQVNVYDSAGELLAFSTLQPGHYQGRFIIPCRFFFTVEGVPDGEQIYSVTIGNRDPYNVTREDASSLSLTLG